MSCVCVRGIEMRESLKAARMHYKVVDGSAQNCNSAWLAVECGLVAHRAVAQYQASSSGSSIIIYIAPARQLSGRRSLATVVDKIIIHLPYEPRATVSR